MEEDNGEEQYRLSESSRAHNKAYYNARKDTANYPDGKSSQVNYKITMGFHTEFILDNEGNFLNEIDPEGTTENGVVNGASFNYADSNDANYKGNGKDKGGWHDQWDGYSSSLYDPSYRNKMIYNDGKSYSSPKLSRKEDEDWNGSYYNDEGGLCH